MSQLYKHTFVFSRGSVHKSDAIDVRAFESELSVRNRYNEGE